ncbi:hypothetical protein [Hufsiella ginkgonis]|uniref:Uncharacterized protein n=1 Tax=Hufsiella ginkgonis TaxID=2695274 RepID=A0A7K1XTL5_9SPHI|nr:hypothetical protein [Hufsiella ginkgonis]MXV13856.1 hypothetical protein [Hufsiella ginkgonis]
MKLLTVSIVFIVNKLKADRWQLKAIFMNNQSNHPEKFEPKDSKEKRIRHPKDDNEAVVKPEDRHYDEKTADFGDVAAKREQSDHRPS